MHVDRVAEENQVVDTLLARLVELQNEKTLGIAPRS